MAAQAQPNILWITAEDICSNLGCYGDSLASTPNLDSFAAKGVRYDNVFSVHPCCSPSRSCLSTGVYPTRLGTHQHRGIVNVSPQEVRTLTSLLKDEGYYCFNGLRYGSYKTDYNFIPADHPWDRIQSQDVEWRRRDPGHPFFGQVNLFETHQSQYGRRKPGTERSEGTTDPAALRIPPYHPDTPAVREIWAEYYDRIALMDRQFGSILQQLEADGLAEDTIVIFLGDNGMGIPGGKVWLWEQGLHVPMIVRVPERWAHLTSLAGGEVSGQIVSFIDFAPTVLTIAGADIPRYMPGIPFLGGQAGAVRDYAFAARDYHTAADFDTSRAVRDRDYHYIRNFMPHIGWDALLYSWDRAPFMLGEWHRSAAEGELLPDTRQAAFFRNGKPVEELYDLARDPYQMRNLAEDADYADVLIHYRGLCEDWMIANRDLGLLSRYELYVRSEPDTPYAMGADPVRNPVQRLVEAADAANCRDPREIPKLMALLQEPDAALRRWGAIGLLSMRQSLQADAAAELLPMLDDPSPDVRITIAEILIGLGDSGLAMPTLIDALHHESKLVRTETLMCLIRIGAAAEQALPYLKHALAEGKHGNVDSADIIPGVINVLQSCLGSEDAKLADEYEMIDYRTSRLKCLQ